MVRIIDERVILGGGQILYLRLARGLIKSGHSVMLYCNSILPIMLTDFKNAGVTICKYDIEYKCPIFDDMEDNDIILTNDLYYFVLCNNYAKKHKIDCKIFLYIVHQLILTSPIKKPYLSKKKYGRFITDAVNSGNIFFMDEQTMTYSIETLNINVNENICRSNILRVPVDIPEVLSNNIIKPQSVLRHQRFEILTIARADFPFKGYMKGLIEAAAELKKQYPNIHLTIISSGDAVMQIKLWMEDAAQKGMSDIALLTDIPNDNLTEYYQRASLYIGMGTTILEAASHAVIAIPIAAFTYQCRAAGYFHTRPEWITAEKIDEGKNIAEFIESVIRLDDKEYESYRMQARQAVEKLYSLQSIVDIFLKKNPSQKYFEPGIILTGIAHLSKIKHYLCSRLKRSTHHAGN